MALKQIYASRAGTNFKPYSIDDTAPIYNYNVAGHNINTYGIKDQSGQEWYLTDGGNWRNVSTQALQATAPTWAAPTPAPVPTPAPAPTPAPRETFKSIWDFQNNNAPSLLTPSLPTTQLTPQNYNLPTLPNTVAADYTPMERTTAPDLRSMNSFIPQNWTPSNAYNYAITQGNKDISTNLAAKGILGSGREDYIRNDLIDRELSKDTDRLMQIAGQDFSAYQTAQQLQQQADIARSQQEFGTQNTNNQNRAATINDMLKQLFGAEANRNQSQFDASTANNLEQYRQEIAQQDNIKSILASMMGQDFNAYQTNFQNDKDRQLSQTSQKISLLQTVMDYMKSLNPLQYGFTATNAQANNYTTLAGALASLSGSGGGGGGGGGAPPLPPIQSGPGGQSGTSDIFSILGNVLPSLIGSFNQE